MLNKSRRQVQTAVLLVIAAVSADVHAADLNGYALLTTDYVRRGVTQSDSSGAVQLGVELALDSGLYFGVWGSTVDIHNGPDQHRDLESNYYIGFTYDVARRWTVGANVVSYRYPGADTYFDYDYIEYSLNANFDDRIWIEYAYSPDLYDSGEETHNLEISSEWAIAGHWSLSAGLGYYDPSALTGSAYSYWQTGVTRRFDRIDVDLRYHDSSRSIPIVSTPDRAKARVALSIRFPF
ncbi:MAG: TorF family putative porin [Gammaproteobacteria bacterium]|nr:TorF family putative porin [Gammaproteobacteria bacterium]MDH3752086.1 TorF family putative porin [Gammaproteobacteria bacterium]MDH3803989.1 TorF family putative porin [Gammaproteobacteria bacterium]